MSEATNPSRLKRVLTLWDLIVYGIVLITPTAPVGIFGISAKIAGGHVTTTILIAMVAMMLTAWSYGRMAVLYPSAGSAYAYVSGALNPHLGFLAGWAMFLDYLIIPVINVIFVSLTCHRLAPQVPFTAWALAASIGITILNLRGIKATARASETMVAVMFVVIGAFVVLAIRYVVQSAGAGGLLSVRPLYDPQTFNLATLGTATSVAALTYIGFDGVTTLAEEVKDPKRSVPLATVLTCLVTGLISATLVYLAQLVQPDWRSLSNAETAFLDISGAVGGNWLFQAMGIILIVAGFASGLTGQASAARLLYGMGRDRVLPPRLFAHLDSKAGPTYNIALIGVMAFAAPMFISYEMAASLLNFGAFLAFMGVNIAAIRVSGSEKAASGPGRRMKDILFPSAGFLFCLVIWLSLPLPAKIAGGIWFIAGFGFLSVRTRWFRRRPAIVDFT